MIAVVWAAAVAGDLTSFFLGRRLGRSFRVKLWPNLVFMKDGAVVKQMARPSAAEMRDGFAAIA